MNHYHKRPDAAQLAYAEDVRRQPLYHTGERRKCWEQLGDIERDTWRRNPTPRDWIHHAPKN